MRPGSGLGSSGGVTRAAITRLGADPAESGCEGCGVQAQGTHQPRAHCLVGWPPLLGTTAEVCRSLAALRLGQAEQASCGVQLRYTMAAAVVRACCSMQALGMPPRQAPAGAATGACRGVRRGQGSLCGAQVPEYFSSLAIFGPGFLTWGHNSAARRRWSTPRRGVRC